MSSARFLVVDGNTSAMHRIERHVFAVVPVFSPLASDVIVVDVVFASFACRSCVTHAVFKECFIFITLG
jgi:hypothetical protein